jgi:hypothetical protein
MCLTKDQNRYARQTTERTPEVGVSRISDDPSNLILRHFGVVEILTRQLHGTFIEDGPEAGLLNAICAIGGSFARGPRVRRRQVFDMPNWFIPHVHKKLNQPVIIYFSSVGETMPR